MNCTDGFISAVVWSDSVIRGHDELSYYLHFPGCLGTFPAIGDFRNCTQMYKCTQTKDLSLV